MVRRAVIVLASLFAFCLYSPAQQAPQMQSSRPDSGLTPSGHFNSVSGSVIGTDNKPVSDVRVELRDFRTGQVVSAMSTGTGGDFEFTGIQPGNYRVVAVSGTQETEETVEVSSWNSLVNLRMPPRDRANDANDKDATRRNTITVAQYRVPEKAREELRKAREASSKGRVDEAQSRVAKA